MDIDKILAKAGDPDLARHQWNLLKKEVPAAQVKKAGSAPFLHLLGNSKFLFQHLLGDSDLLADLTDSSSLKKPKGKARMAQELSRDFSRFSGDLRSAQRLLRRFKYREIIRIAVRELSGRGSFDEMGREIADVASVSLEQAWQAARRILREGKDLQQPFTILGLGKLGGIDLNFSSDVDLLYVYGLPDSEVTMEWSQGCHHYFTRLAEMITTLMQDRTEDGIVFRVDLNLRPEGRSGPLVNSLDALVGYYEIAGQPWERAALIKARSVAGDEGLGREIATRLEPFVYPKATDLSAIGELKKMKEKINQELQRNRTPTYHVKLGKGGIREIEFFVSAFQLLYGGREMRLREQNTLAALQILGEIGLVPASDAVPLRDAYIFLRRIENFLQMEDEGQVHALPADAAELRALARKMGFSETPEFQEALRQKTDFVNACFERLAS